jgi:hypothetical protein
LGPFVLRNADHDKRGPSAHFGKAPQYVVADSNIEVMVDDRGKKNSSLVLLEVRDLVNKSPQMSASGSDLATDGPVCPHFGSDCWANFSTCVRIRIGHGRFFAPIYVRIGIEPLTA